MAVLKWPQIENRVFFRALGLRGLRNLYLKSLVPETFQISCVGCGNICIVADRVSSGFSELEAQNSFSFTYNLPCILGILWCCDLCAVPLPWLQPITWRHLCHHVRLQSISDSWFWITDSCQVCRWEFRILSYMNKCQTHSFLHVEIQNEILMFLKISKY